jgi:hemin uptake protein HemP
MYWGKSAGSNGGGRAVAERDDTRPAKLMVDGSDRVAELHEVVAACAPALSSAPAGDPPQRLTSAALFQGGRLVLIEHAGGEYRLQITSRGKLILTR